MLLKELIRTDLINPQEQVYTMTTQSTEKKDTEFLRKEAEKLMNEHRENIRKQAEVMLSKSDRDLAGMSSADIEKLVFEL